MSLIRRKISYVASTVKSTKMYISGIPRDRLRCQQRNQRENFFRAVSHEAEKFNYATDVSRENEDENIRLLFQVLLDCTEAGRTYEA